MSVHLFLLAIIAAIPSFLTRINFIASSLLLAAASGVVCFLSLQAGLFAERGVTI
jgi:hypothetical protein